MRRVWIGLLVAALVTTGCAQPMTRTQKGAAIGTGAGAAVGAGLGQAIGKNTKGTLIGAGIGAVVGGLAGGLIGNYMDKQEAAMREQLAGVEGANVQRNVDLLTVTFKSDLLFDVNSASLKPGAFDEIQRVATVLNQYPETNILIGAAGPVGAKCPGWPGGQPRPHEHHGSRRNAAGGRQRQRSRPAAQPSGGSQNQPPTRIADTVQRPSAVWTLPTT
jgi:hypothetical protein